ncbi:MAG: hypothetical protein ACFFBD_28700, partial [Candidatus Hodarchaeota archaeon]
MKFTRTGTFNKNFLEGPVTIKPMEEVGNIFLERLDYFIGFLAKEDSKNISDYVKNLTKKYQGLIENDVLKNSTGKIENLYAKFKNLNQYPDLNKAS